VCVLDETQARAIARFAVDKLGKPPVAIVQDATQSYSKSLATAFEADYKARGGSIVATLSFTGGNPDFKAQVDTIKKSGARAVYVPAYYGDAALLARALDPVRAKITMLGADAWDSMDFVKIGGAAVDGAYFVNHFTPTDPRPEVKAFVAAYKARHKTEPDSLAALGYDAANLLMEAMERAPSLSGKDLGAAIRATKAFAGVTGAITIDTSGNPTKAVHILRIVGGGAKHIATITP
jgi:branched-chain amino acid transport system substrate-binding protein